MADRRADSPQLDDANNRLVHLNRVLRAIRDVNQLITHASDLETLLSGACRCLTSTRGYFSAWIILLDEQENPVGGYQSNVSDIFSRMVDNACWDQVPRCLKDAIRSRSLEVFANPAIACDDCPLHETYEEHAGMAQALEVEGRIVGVLSASIPPAFVDDEEEQALFSELADDLAYAIHSLEFRNRRDQVQETLQRANLIVESSPSIVFQWFPKPDWPVAYVSQNISILGYRREDFLSGHLSYRQIIHPEDLGCVTQEVRGHMQGQGDRFRQEYRVIDNDGKTRWVEDHTRVQRNSEGDVESLHGIVTDITQRKQSEQALRESEARYRTLVEQSGDCLLIHDFESRLLDVNDFACEKYGYTRRELLSMKVCDLDPDYWKREDDGSFWEGLKLYEPVFFEARQIKKNGEIFPVEVRLSIIRYHGHKAIMGFCRDISRQKKMQQELIESEQRFRSFVENANDIVYALNPEGVFTYISPNWMEHMGQPAEEAIGRSFEHYVHPEDVHLCREFLQSVLCEGNQKRSVEYRVRRADGGQRWHVSTGSSLSDEAGTPNAYIGIARDVTETRQAERAIEANEARLRAVLDAADGVPIQGYDSGRRVIFWNGASEKLYGYSRKEALGKRIEELILPPTMRDHAVKTIADWQEHGAAIPAGEITLQDKQGRDIPVYSSHAMITNAQGQPEMFCIDVDLTQRKQTEEALRQSEQRYRTLAENYPDGALFLFDADLKYLSAAGTELANVGLRTEDIVGRPMSEVFPELVDIIVPAAREVLAGRSNSYELEYCGNTYSNLLIPIRDTAGEIAGGLAIVQNITEKKQMEQKVRHLEKMEAVGRLAGGVAHDFNNMLTVILGNVQVSLAEAKLPEELRASLAEIENAAQRSADLTRQLLAFARKQTIAPEVLDLNDTIEGMLKMFRRLIGEDIDLAWAPGQDLWTVKVDPGQIDQLMVNLCLNARDAIPGVGKLTIETSNRHFDPEYCREHSEFAPGDYVQLAISDDGCGMDAQTRERIFEPFFTTKDEGQGTGLGLATVYGIVRQNDGYIHVYSEPDQGTTFRIYLPRHQQADDNAREDPQPPPLKTGTETIVLVEDEPAILRLGTGMLESLGYHVLAAASPSEALEMVENHSNSVDLLVTDVVMPEMNGRELARRLTEKYPQIRCLYTSGYTANVIAHHGVLDEGVNFLQKPFSREQLAGQVRQILDEND